MTLFLDACIVIYWVESKNPFYTKLLQILNAIRSKFPSSDFAVSRLTLLECRIKPLQERNEGLLKLYEDFFSMEDLQIIEMDADVVDQATLLRAHHGLKTPDALQAASALRLERETLFLTSDPKFKKVPDQNVELV